MCESHRSLFIIPGLLTLHSCLGGLQCEMYLDFVSERHESFFPPKYLVFSKHNSFILIFTSKGVSLVHIILHYQEYIITTLCFFLLKFGAMDCNESLQAVQKCVESFKSCIFLFSLNFFSIHEGQHLFSFSSD
jgi:hypothetical protein